MKFLPIALLPIAALAGDALNPVCLDECESHDSVVSQIHNVFEGMECEETVTSTTFEMVCSYEYEEFSTRVSYSAVTCDDGAFHPDQLTAQYQNEVGSSIEGTNFRGWEACLSDNNIFKYIPTAFVRPPTPSEAPVCFDACESHNSVVSQIHNVFEGIECEESVTSTTFEMVCSYEYEEFSTRVLYSAVTCNDGAFHPDQLTAQYQNEVGSSIEGTDFRGWEACLSDNNIFKYIPTAFVGPPTPSEAPYSEFPSSEFPSSEFPSSEFPSSEFPSSEIPSAITSYANRCPDTHEEVMTRLYGAFGEEHCEVAKAGDPHPSYNYVLGYPVAFCSVDLFGFTAFAEYLFNEQEMPGSLDVSYAYHNDDGSLLSSGIVSSYFVEACLDDSEINGYFNQIDNNIHMRSCPNKPDPIAYKPNKSITCEALAEKRHKQTKSLCGKFEDLSKHCVGICRSTDYCQCVDNPYPFPLSRDKKLTCATLADLSDKYRMKKCKKAKVYENCPTTCGICQANTF